MIKKEKWGKWDQNGVRMPDDDDIGAFVRERVLSRRRFPSREGGEATQNSLKEKICGYRRGWVDGACIFGDRGRGAGMCPGVGSSIGSLEGPVLGRDQTRSSGRKAPERGIREGFGADIHTKGQKANLETRQKKSTGLLF